jgi:hypothetical protein
MAGQTAVSASNTHAPMLKVVPYPPGRKNPAAISSILQNIVNQPGIPQFFSIGNSSISSSGRTCLLPNALAARIPLYAAPSKEDWPWEYCIPQGSNSQNRSRKRWREPYNIRKKEHAKRQKTGKHHGA